MSEIVEAQESGENNDRFLGLTKDTFSLVALCACMVMVLASIGVLTYAVSVNRRSVGQLQAQASLLREQDARITQLAQESHTGLCGVRYNAQKQIETTADFLAQHSGPEPIPGITRATLEQSLQRQRALRDALNPVDCRDFQPPGA